MGKLFCLLGRPTQKNTGSYLCFKMKNNIHIRKIFT